MSDASPYRVAADRPFVDVMPEQPEDKGASQAERLLAETCARWLVTPSELRAPGRSTQLVADARRSLMFALRDLGWKYKRIGAFVNRHHSTVMWSLGVLTKPSHRKARAA